MQGTAGVTRDHNAGVQDQVSEVTNPADPNGPPLLGVFPLPAVINSTTRNWALNLQQNLFSWTNWMTLKAASHQVAQAEANYRAAEQDLILRVAQAYFDCAGGRGQPRGHQASLEAITHQLDQANKRFEVGLIAVTDVQEAKAARDTAAAAVIAAKRTLATSEEQLREITGQKYDSLAKPGTDMPLEDARARGRGAMGQHLARTEPVAHLEPPRRRHRARQRARIAFGGHLPTLDLVAGRSCAVSRTRTRSSSSGTFPATSTAIQRPADRRCRSPCRSSAAACTQSQVRQAQYRWIAAKERVVQTSRATERQARDAYLGVISGIARVQALRQALESSQTALKATEAGYEVGTRTAVDVLNARRRWCRRRPTTPAAATTTS